MIEPIENLYFNWLCTKVTDPRSKLYYDLLGILHRTEYVWTVYMDENRAHDGLELRNDFYFQTGVEQDLVWESQPCSLLEFFIAFAKRASFQTDFTIRSWFWEFMNNLKLDEYRQVLNSDIKDIDDILYTFVWRQYAINGIGGMFPLRNSYNDQRQVEIWYQFSEYIQDRGLY